jgi:hypothetical protein
MCMCYRCAIDVVQNRGALCPICRQPIRDVIKIYRSWLDELSCLFCNSNSFTFDHRRNWVVIAVTYGVTVPVRITN